MNNVACFGLIIIGLVAGQSNDLQPGIFRKCPRYIRNYGECIKHAANEAIVSLSQGFSRFNIPPLEPLEIDDMVIGATGRTVSLKQNYRNIKLHGLTKGFHILHYDIDFDNLIFRSHAINEKVDFVADYALQGQIFVFPIRGSGRSNITMLGLQSKNAMHCQKYMKNGEIYLNVTRYDIKFNPDKVLLDFNNVINGESALSNQLNNFLSSSSDAIFRETQSAYEETFGLVFAKIANEVFSRIPFNSLFPEF